MIKTFCLEQRHSRSKRLSMARNDSTLNCRIQGFYPQAGCKDSSHSFRGKYLSVHVDLIRHNKIQNNATVVLIQEYNYSYNYNI